MKKRLLIITAILLFIFSGVYLSVPEQLFSSPCSTVVNSYNNRLLGARIASDGQWRFPPQKTVPEKYKKCLITFEDRYFYYHPGVNLISIFKALVRNIKARHIVSGGSTITMQVCRMARRQKPRTIINKLIEMAWAFIIELKYSKNDILKLYSSNAPFGGNVVGLDAAAWRYFNRQAGELSWAESATLAVLPNAPSLIYPGKLDNKLKAKRNRLLKKLLIRGYIDTLTFRLSIAEPLPSKVTPLPLNAYHLTELIAKNRNGQRVKTTIDYSLQQKVARLAQQHSKKLQANHIYNIAVIVAETHTKSVKAYVGNVFDGKSTTHDNHVDITHARRSTGSILKPFLYCKMLDEGFITPQMLIPDIPTRFGGFTPLNFDHKYNGAVPAADALARSLNIPAVRMLQNYGVAPFYNFVKRAGMKTLTESPGHYGLSLILGGAETTLWDLTGMYTSLVNILNNYNEKDGYFTNQFSGLNIGITELPETEVSQPVVRASSIYLTLQALLEVKRPEQEAGWREFTSARNIAWKTGTSFGFRDAWAVGMTKDYVVGVWAGNADGEGRPGLTGVNAAAPLLFDIFELLPASEWFDRPDDELRKIKVCANSGYRAGENCDSTVNTLVPSGTKVKVCKWHKKIHLDKTGTFRVNANCYPVSAMIHKNWFVLPPAMEYYYKQNNILYRTLPPLKKGCINDIINMEFIYPQQWNKIFIPVYLDGTQGEIIFELVNRQKSATVYWHLDNKYIGSTTGIHQFAIKPQKGWHTINVTDNYGNRLTKKFQIVNKQNGLGNAR